MNQLSGSSWQPQPTLTAWPALGQAVAGGWDALEARRAQKSPCLAYRQHCVVQH